MRVLAIGANGPVAASTCLVDAAGTTVTGRAMRVAAGEADLLPAQVQACLHQADWHADELDLIACGVGPGGFTAIRVGVALARALALATGVPVMAVSTFEALAVAARACGTEVPLRIAVPGGRGNWHVQDVDAAGRFGPISTGPSPPSGGAGFQLIGGEAPEAVQLVAGAEEVGLAAARRLLAGEQGMGGEMLVPLYLRGADAREGAGRSLLDLAGAA
ncbi:tRNA (adenosine(37)-N6)-threonylcarbamoyltransferase complex dimerization subunit type 1 TsaB [Geminicoccus flavidas]|uniref:tRNA (adenosine(37)-N6)-threonylcarbamoyltransferase complex dimerization subunit type 1 TsaB n=1 Tax=Geminicoccus flavidas TaxID=2506407 RepID=UPI001356CC41|nr:tRNA (adenosine(37)-N6)-threonylcarbamoyltransferase complex dimerization subunit type 1 TsaB [Geminicoccus flavidas]